MRGTLTGVLRTLLVVGGFLLLAGGIVTLAFPSLLGVAGIVETSDGAGFTTLLGSESVGASLRGIVWGMTLAAAGLALPGRSTVGLVREQPFTARQRKFVLVGAVLVVGLPVARRVARQFGYESLLVAVLVPVLSVVGGILVVLGASGGLQQAQQVPVENQNS